MRRIILAGSLLLALSSPVMASQIYKWVDAQGTTHFGAQPPQGQLATSVNPVIAPPKPHEADTSPAPQATDSGADAQKAIDQKVKSEVAEQEARRAEYCTSVRTNLAQLENNPRVRMEVQGEMRRLGEEERQSKITEAKKAIAENCQ